MPNYVENTLRVRGTLEERERFMKAIFVPRPTFEEYEAQERADALNQRVFEGKEEKFLEHVTKQYEKTSDHLSILHVLYPCPKVLIESASPPRNLTPEQATQLVEEYGFVDRYGWCIHKWGSKWGDFNDKQICHDKKITVLTFESAWTSPQVGMVEVSKQFPLLHFRVNWKEEDCHWGMYSYRNGEIKRYWEGRYR